VSGERIVLADAAQGNAARLVQATARLAEAHLGPHALIGGLAVMCRLAAVHRATQDVDTVAETTAPTAVEVITSSIGTPDASSPNRVLVDGVKIDVIDIERLRYEDLDGIDLGDRTGGVAEALTAAPFGLGYLVGEALRTRVAEEPERAVRWLHDGGPEMDAVTPDDLRDVIGPLIDGLLA
jgi:hypothetical protein